MRFPSACLTILIGTLASAWAEEKPASPRGATTQPAEAAAKPLVLFVGDSVTRGGPRADYAKGAPFTPRIGQRSGERSTYSYVEALCEATVCRDIPYRFDKIGAGGQSISGQYAGLKGHLRRILERRHGQIKELPAILVYQDFECCRTPEEIEAHKAAIREIHEWAKKEPSVRFVFSTVAWEPGGTFSGNYPEEALRKTNEAILEVAKELGIPVIRLDLAWERYREHIKDRKDAAGLMLTFQGRYLDGVHPGRTGQFFQAMVFARELGIPPEKFDEKAKALAVAPELAAEIEAFVYSWTDPTLVPLPGSKQKQSRVLPR